MCGRSGTPGDDPDVINDGGPQRFCKARRDAAPIPSRRVDRTEFPLPALRAHRYLRQRSPLNVRHFVRWLATRNNTIDEMFRGPIAERAKIQGARIAWAMQ